MSYVKLIVFLLVVYLAVVLWGVVGVYRATDGYTPECTGEACA